jgi:hypothetical protein
MFQREWGGIQWRLLDSLDECLRDPIDDTRNSAISALKVFTRQYFPVGDKGMLG